MPLEFLRLTSRYKRTVCQLPVGDVSINKVTSARKLEIRRLVRH